jgi:hypothetical protein
MTASDSADTIALETLGAELEARGFEAHLVIPPGKQPWLAVRNPRAVVMTEDVMAQGGWFWWPWADRIAPAEDIPAAVARIATVLRAAGSDG